MQGLLFNLLANMAQSTDCEDEVWEVVLACADSLLLSDELDDWDPDILRLPELDVTTGALFRCLLRSGIPFRDADWSDIPGTEPKTLSSDNDEDGRDAEFLPFVSLFPRSDGSK